MPLLVTLLHLIPEVLGHRRRIGFLVMVAVSNEPTRVDGILPHGLVAR